MHIEISAVNLSKTEVPSSTETLLDHRFIKVTVRQSFPWTWTWHRFYEVGFQIVNDEFFSGIITCMLENIILYIFIVLVKHVHIQHDWNFMADVLGCFTIFYILRKVLSISIKLLKDQNLGPQIKDQICYCTKWASWGTEKSER